MKKTRQFKRLLTSPRLEFLYEAHNGLSAPIVEEAGFKGIWGSGLAISSQLGVRDSNEVSCVLLQMPLFDTGSKTSV